MGLCGSARLRDPLCLSNEQVDSELFQLRKDINILTDHVRYLHEKIRLLEDKQKRTYRPHSYEASDFIGTGITVSSS